jgi:hypothetical protein
MMVITKSSNSDRVPENIEKENLAAHVEICMTRYNALEHRLDAVEREIDHFVIENDSTRQTVIQAMVAGGTLLAVLVPATAIFLERMK